MTLANAYWVIMLIWLVLSAWAFWPARSFALVGGNLVLFALLVIVGWKVFGPPIHG